MKGWMSQKTGTSSFCFTVDENGDLQLYYEDNKDYPSLWVDNQGNIMCEYKNWYPNLSIDNNLNIIYTYDSEPLITMDKDFNIIYEVKGAMGFDKMFYVDDNGDLIYKYNGKPLDLKIDENKNIIMNID